MITKRIHARDLPRDTTLGTIEDSFDRLCVEKGYEVIGEIMLQLEINGGWHAYMDVKAPGDGDVHG